MLLEFFQAVTGIFVVVYDGQHALKFTLGRAQEVVGPGVHFKWPVFQKFAVEETKHTTLDLEPQIIQLVDDLVIEVDAKVVYRIINLRKAMIEIDDLVAGMRNRVVLSVQGVLRAQNRESIKETDRLIDEILAELRPMEEEWGVQILLFGFSNFSPSPTTLEITQLDLLARERLNLFKELRGQGLSEEAAVALIAGAVVSVQPPANEPSVRELRAGEEVQYQATSIGIDVERKAREVEERKRRERLEDQGESGQDIEEFLEGLDEE